MLQIISGKFYGDRHIYNNPKEMVLYSNAEIQNVITIAGIKITPVCNIKKDSFWNRLKGKVCRNSNHSIRTTKVFKYLINFDNKIAQQHPTFSIVDAWSEVVLYQLKNVLMFYLDTFWDEDEAAVRKMCRERVRKGSRMEYVPANYLRTLFDERCVISEEKLQRTMNDVEDLIALSRADYCNVITCIRTYCSSIRLLENDPNLAYSMPIFALESLSQNYDEYVPVWDDYDEKIKGKLNKKFKELDANTCEDIKNILIEDAHLKLSKRFLHFILSYVDDEFYFQEDVNNKILKDDLERAIYNAYNIRSKYAHALKTIIDQSAIDDISKVSDFHRYMNEPYLTYSGLLRLTRYVIINFISRREKVEKECVDWTENLPGMINVKLGPDFWMSKLEANDCAGASKRLEGYIKGISNNKAYDIREVMDLYIKNFDHVSEEAKRSIFALCIIWKDTVKHTDEEIDKYKQFIHKNINRINICCIQNIVIFTFLLQDTYMVEWEEETLEKVILEYIKKRKNEKAFLFPNLIETNMYLLAADILKEDEVKSKFWIDKARYNSANSKEVLDIINSNCSIREKIELIWGEIRKLK